MDTEPSDGPSRGPTDEVARLRRELRALAAVNRQLYAQVESGKVRGADRRLTPASDWLAQLQLNHGGEPFLVRTATRGTYVIEGRIHRLVKAGLLVAALTKLLGAPRETSDGELDHWAEGPPVEVMEARSGPAFVVIGGRRLPVRGLPLSFFVTNEEMLGFPEGEELVVGTTRAVPPGRAAQARSVLRREGPARGAAKLIAKASRRLRARSGAGT